MRRIFELLVAKDGQAQMETQRVSIEDDDEIIRRVMVALAEELSHQGHSGEIYISRIYYLPHEGQTKKLLDKQTIIYGQHRMGP